MKVQSQFRTQKQAIAYLERRGWERTAYDSDLGLVKLVRPGTTWRNYIYRRSAGCWVIQAS